MKYFIQLSIFFLGTTLCGQSATQVREALGSIQNKSDFESLKKSHSDWWFTISEHPLDKVSMNSNMKEFVNGKIRTQTHGTGTYMYKVLDVEAKSQFRARYIYLDGSTLTKKEIDERRGAIMDQYKKGASFVSLFDKYNMDENASQGDLGWFGEGVSDVIFEEAIRSHQKDDIFTIDVDHQKWYYVCLKTHDNKSAETMIVGVVKVAE